MFTISPFKRLLCLDATDPDFENNRSRGTDVAGVHKYFLASAASVGNFISFLILMFCILMRHTV
jgi:hypothetical protein